MSDVLDAVRSADSVPRNAWSATAEGRAARERVFTPVPELAPRNRPRRRLPALVAGALVLGLVVTAAVMVTSRGDREVTGPEPAPVASRDLYDGEWQVIGPQPTHEYQHFDAVWTGEEVLVVDVSQNWPTTVSSLDPRTGTWTELPAPPDGVGTTPDVVWTGTDLILWSGGIDGASYDPEQRTWTPMPPAPMEPRRGAAAVWTGQELVVLGGDTCLDTGGVADCAVGPVLQRGAAYDPDTGRWRQIATAPVLLTTVASAVASGGMVVVVDPQPLGLVLSYDPDTDAWRTLSSGSPSGYPTAFRGDVVTFELRSAGANRPTEPGLDEISANRVDLVTGTASPFGSAPLRFVCGPATAVVPGGIAVGCPEWVRVAPASGKGPWRAVPSPPLQRQIDDLVWTGRQLVATVSGGEVMVYTPGERLAPAAPTSEQLTRGAWRYLRNGALAELTMPTSVWTGRELLAWSSADDHGVAFDPRTRRWSEIPPSGVVGGEPPLWVGGRMVVWAGATASEFGAPSAGAAYDPDRRAWTPIAPAPVRRPTTVPASTQAFAADDSLVVVGAEVVCGATADCDAWPSYAAEYVPSTDTWRELPPWPAPRDPSAPAVSPVRVISGGWDGDRLVVLDLSCSTCGVAWALDLRAGVWTTLPTRPDRAGQFPVRYSAQVLWLGTSQPFALRRGGTTWEAMPITSGRDVGGNASLAAVPVGTDAVVLHGRNPHAPSKVLDVDRGRWVRMPSPRRDFGMSVTGGRAWWTGREVLVLLARPGSTDSEQAVFDVGVYTPGR